MMAQPPEAWAEFPISTPISATVLVEGSKATERSTSEKWRRLLIEGGRLMPLVLLPKAARMSLMLGRSMSEVLSERRSRPVGSVEIAIGIGVCDALPLMSSVAPTLTSTRGWSPAEESEYGRLVPPSENWLKANQGTPGMPSWVEAGS